MSKGRQKVALHLTETEALHNKMLRSRRILGVGEVMVDYPEYVEAMVSAEDVVQALALLELYQANGTAEQIQTVGAGATEPDPEDGLRYHQVQWNRSRGVLGQTASPQHLSRPLGPLFSLTGPLTVQSLH